MKEMKGIDEAAPKRSVLRITTLAAFLVAFGLSATHVTLPTIGEASQMNSVLLGWVATAYFPASAVL